MQRFPRPVSMVLIVLVLAAGASVAGCAQPSQQQEGAASQQSEASEPAPVVEPMQADQKRSEIDSGFPIEVPVPIGTVVRGEAQGSDAWDYELLIASTPRAVADWYRQSYTGRGWSVISERAAGTDGTELTLVKGGAQSRVTVAPDGGGSRAQVILGVGAPVLETQ